MFIYYRQDNPHGTYIRTTYAELMQYLIILKENDAIPEHGMGHCHFTCFATSCSVVTHNDTTCCNYVTVVTPNFHLVTFCMLCMHTVVV